MGTSNAANDPTTLTFEADVESGGSEVVLSETYFYPEGGGQPADRGTLAGLSVLDVQQRAGDVVHVVDGELDAGETVSGAVDPAFRRYCRRAHTASHVLYGAGRRLFDEIGYGGFDISAERRASDADPNRKVRVDFATSTTIDDGMLVDLERLANRCVWASRAVTWRTLPQAEALDRPDVAFNTKTEEGLDGDTVRIVEVEGWDVAACGGTHVENTCEIGPVTVLGRSNPGEGRTRVEFTVGPSAIDRRTTEKRAALDSAAALGTGVDELVDAVRTLRTECETLERELDALTARLLDAKLEELTADAFERDGHTWVAGVVDADGDALTDRVRDLPSTIDVLVLVTPDGRVSVGTTGAVSATDVVDDVTDEFGGGGGGSDTVAQAGGLSVDGDAVVSYLR